MSEGHTPSPQAQIARLAAAMLGGKIEFIQGSREIVSLGHAANMSRDQDILPFIAIDSETDALPLAAEVRELWQREALERLQPQIDQAQNWARSIGELHCRNLLARFGGSSPHST